MNDQERYETNNLPGHDLRRIANARYEGSPFKDWTKATLLQDVNIGGVVLKAGDSLLFASGRGKSVKAWSPFVKTTMFFILPVSHISVDE